MGQKETMRAPLATVALAISLTACTSREKPKEGSEDLAPFAVAALPEDAHRANIDFGGKMRIAGYSVSPEGGTAKPSEQVSLKLYWERVGALSPGFAPFTHLYGDTGKQIRNYDKDGPFRGKLAEHKEGFALLDFGKLYLDDQTLDLPKAEDLTPRVAFVVGVWQDETRLPVVSGVTNGQDAALVAKFDTGVERRRPIAQADAKKGQ